MFLLLCVYESMHVYWMCIQCVLLWYEDLLRPIAPKRHGEYLFYFLRTPIPTSLQNFKAVKRFLIFQDLQTNKQTKKVTKWATDLAKFHFINRDVIFIFTYLQFSKCNNSASSNPILIKFSPNVLWFCVESRKNIFLEIGRNGGKPKSCCIHGDAV